MPTTPSATDQQAVLRAPFDIETHRQTFIKYLEVCIDPEGTVHYAVPSHQQWLIRRYMEQQGYGDEREAWDDLPTWCDAIEDFARLTGCVAVWRGFYVGEPNARQRAVLRRLKIEGLYEGRL